MVFSRIDNAIALVKKSATSAPAIDPQLQSFLVGYLVVDIISEFEQRLEAMFCMRATKLGDKPNANFVANMLDRKFRSPSVGKINEMLRDHDDSILLAFSSRLAGIKWDSSMANLMLGRHYYVHKEGGSPAMTLMDVERAYNEAVKLFDAIAYALGLTTKDCAAFT